MTPVMFKAIGGAVALYTLYAAISGQVYAKAGPGGRTVSRQATPVYFWTVIVIYAGLSAALMTVF
jgi:hypothetical protein